MLSSCLVCMKGNYGCLIDRCGLIDYAVAFFLLSPQFSLSFLPIVDGYFILFFFLLFHMVLIQKKIHKRIVCSVLFLAFIPVLVLLCQYVFLNEGNVIYSNLIEAKGREIDTYGFYVIEKIFLFDKYNLLILSKIGLAGLFLVYISSKNVKQIMFFLQRVITLGVFYQLLWYLSYSIGLVSVINELFFMSNFTEGHRSVSDIFVRNGFPRFSFGFSEPSFGAAIMLVCFGFLAYLSRYTHISLFEKIKYCLFFIILTVSTMSTTMLGGILFIFFMFGYISKRVTSTILWLFISVIHIAFAVFKIPFITENYPSIAFRLFRIADTSSFDINNVLFGVRLGMVYTQPPMYSIYIQMGIIGILIYFLFLRSYVKIGEFPVAMLLLAMISVSSLYNAYLWLIVSMVLGINFIILNNRNDEFRNNII